MWLLLLQQQQVSTSFFSVWLQATNSLFSAKEKCL